MIVPVFTASHCWSVCLDGRRMCESLNGKFSCANDRQWPQLRPQGLCWCWNTHHCPCDGAGFDCCSADSQSQKCQSSVSGDCSALTNKSFSKLALCRVYCRDSNLVWQCRINNVANSFFLFFSLNFFKNRRPVRYLKIIRKQELVLRVLDTAEYSAFESTLNSLSYRIVS